MFYASSSQAGTTYFWIGPNSFASATSSPVMSSMQLFDTGYYILSALYNSCTVHDTVLVTAACLDSVWPGDVNSDHVVDNQDALDLALGYGYTGYARTSASIGWTPRFCHDWGFDVVAGVDMKHADCDGNGTVNSSDTAAVAANYGQTHPRGIHHVGAKVTGYPDLYFDLSGISLVAGTTVTIPIKLGTSAVPMSNILGLAAQVKVNGITLGSNASISYPASWLGSAGNTFSFRKSVTPNQVDWACARNDHQNVTGNGTIASITLAIPPNANPQQMVLSFENVKMIDNAGNEITAYNVSDDTANVNPSGVASFTTREEYYNIMPNPSGAQCELQMLLTAQANIEIKVTDVTGKVIWNHSEENVNGTKSVSLPAPTITSGIYMIHVQTNGLSSTVLKWVRN